MILIIKAAQFANLWHEGQKRKYTDRPYIEHPGRVAARISRHQQATESRIAAAWLHDVVEDCGITMEQLTATMGERVAALVDELTNTSKTAPGLNRAQRKSLDRQRIKHISTGAMLIKLADRADNLREMERGSEFARLYAAESRLLLEVLAGTDEELEREFTDALTFAETEP